ncbi:Hypothetical predicted protein [Olea europaea subsp. europaea]|uniref:Uncharacterized protein n=1 Tax=Olea europaea subsp. europaea TaxID=158383 RepID=A0A8S0PXF0_OLEEU|nr:Hypothetical predicted protein [Olea europaea subsp. europaea]
MLVGLEKKGTSSEGLKLNLSVSRECTFNHQSVVEIQSVTRRVVAEFPGLGPGLVEPANKCLPLRTGHKLRPFPRFVDCFYTFSPPTTHLRRFSSFLRRLKPLPYGGAVRWAAAEIRYAPQRAANSAGKCRFLEIVV